MFAILCVRRPENCQKVEKNKNKVLFLFRPPLQSFLWSSILFQYGFCWNLAREAPDCEIKNKVCFPNYTAVPFLALSELDNKNKSIKKSIPPKNEDPFEEFYMRHEKFYGELRNKSRLELL